ncbi:hypothetical protein STCU_11632 [Strigomonas culicis]|uniref:Uncharacterized protein n=1 Tax=Strigomonas culicis TaxID=28005 RepID=S9TD82_9TRYP|nr:hypothetical protein STCU_11632 [Strigomonas culicis]|eukprot:EPY15977.1 hypothetical protein STCU_11632 [Strigomonas culicis]
MSRIEMDLEEMQEAAAAQMVEPVVLQYEVNTLAAVARQSCERYGYIADEVRGAVWYGAGSPRAVVIKLLLGIAEPQFCLRATAFPLQSAPPPVSSVAAAAAAETEAPAVPFVNMFEALFRDDLHDNSDAAAACGFVWQGQYHACSLQAAQHHDAAVAAATTSQQRRAAAAQRRLGPLLWPHATLLGCGWQRVYAPRGVPAFQRDRGTRVVRPYGVSGALPEPEPEPEEAEGAPAEVTVATTVLVAHGYETLEAVCARESMSADEVRRYIQNNGDAGGVAAAAAVVDLHSALGVALRHPRHHPVPVDAHRDRVMVLALRAAAAQVGAALCAADPPAAVPPTPLAAPELLVQRSLTDPAGEAVLLLDVQAALRRFAGKSFIIHLYERPHERGAAAATAELTGFQHIGMIRYAVHLTPYSGPAVRTVATLRQGQSMTQSITAAAGAAGDDLAAAAYTAGLELPPPAGAGAEPADGGAAGWPVTAHYFQEREGTIIAPLRHTLNPPLRRGGGSGEDRLRVRVSVQFRARGEAVEEASPQVVALQHMIAKLEIENKVDERGTVADIDRDALQLVPDDAPADEPRSGSLSTAEPPTPDHPHTAPPVKVELPHTRLTPAEMGLAAPAGSPAGKRKKKSASPSPAKALSAATGFNSSVTSATTLFDRSPCDHLLHLPPLTAPLPEDQVLHAPPAAVESHVVQHLQSLPLREAEAVTEALLADAARATAQLAEARQVIGGRITHLERDMPRRKGKELAKARDELTLLQAQLAQLAHEVAAVGAAAAVAQTALRTRSRTAVLRVARLAELQRQLALLKQQELLQQPLHLTAPRLGERSAVQGTLATAVLWLLPRAQSCSSLVTVPLPPRHWKCSETSSCWRCST